jgi:hypothetical protein
MTFLTFLNCELCPIWGWWCIPNIVNAGSLPNQTENTHPVAKIWALKSTGLWVFINEISKGVKSYLFDVTGMYSTHPNTLIPTPNNPKSRTLSPFTAIVRVCLHRFELMQVWIISAEIGWIGGVYPPGLVDRFSARISHLKCSAHLMLTEQHPGIRRGLLLTTQNSIYSSD